MSAFNKLNNKFSRLWILAFICVASLSSSCSKTQSYSELLRDEEHAVNWYLAQKRVELDIPKDSISFETGENAPFYKLDEDGNVYMQVINRGSIGADGKAENRVSAGEQVYFRFTRSNILNMYEYGSEAEEGNSNDVVQTAAYFLYKNTSLNASTQWGTGIQMPLRFFGYDCEVNLVLKSYCGFVTDQTYCYPYVINVRYFKPEY